MLFALYAVVDALKQRLRSRGRRKTLRFHQGGRRCAVVGCKARGRLGGQAVWGCIPVEKGLLLSTSGAAADEVPGMHCLFLDCL